ncbi:hypothetical protein KFZ58_08180 [Virgibacillus sp. NKC19-16]|uniref:hypothetical protein n=1 Tax=Virgibacillus salidurans TaxID=2831673 RepID=UPI001F2DC59B|nr:hypothetical protein [Virgibacillus sp. NKC19-16]UJL47815.1 hypothetical protein KFZ58_08180 [Virgibacillus sp. NKC19-16]
MKKRYILSAGAAGAIGAAVTGYFLKDQENRDKLKQNAKNVTDKFKTNKNTGNTLLEDAGIPDQSSDSGPAQRDNAKMVDEGSQFGVQYYNEVKEENTN